MVGGGKGVEGEDAQGRRTIQHDEIEALLENGRPEKEGEALQMVFSAGDFDFRAAEVHLAGDDAEAVEGGGFDFFLQGALAEEGAVGAGADGFFQAQAAGGVGLGVQVHEQNTAAQLGQASREVDRRGGLSNAAFLVGDRNDFRRHGGSIRQRKAA